MIFMEFFNGNIRFLPYFDRFFREGLYSSKRKDKIIEILFLHIECSVPKAF